MLIYQEFLALNNVNEMAAFDPSERLRYAIHEIMISMKDGETIKFEDLSKKLKNHFKIDIASEILKEIFDKWDRYNNPDYSVFKKEDKNWMDVWVYQGYVKRKCRDKQSFGKHRKKETPTYHTGSYSSYEQDYYGYGGRRGGSYKNGVWIPDKKDDDRFNHPLETYGD